MIKGVGNVLVALLDADEAPKPIKELLVRIGDVVGNLGWRWAKQLAVAERAAPDP